VDPILRDTSPPCEYETNTWGPLKAERTLAPERGWHNPEAKEVSQSRDLPRTYPRSL